jgi:hypothetical protein
MSLNTYILPAGEFMIKRGEIYRYTHTHTHTHTHTERERERERERGREGERVDRQL